MDHGICTYIYHESKPNVGVYILYTLNMEQLVQLLTPWGFYHGIFQQVLWERDLGDTKKATKKESIEGLFTIMHWKANMVCFLGISGMESYPVIWGISVSWKVRGFFGWLDCKAEKLKPSGVWTKGDKLAICCVVLYTILIFKQNPPAKLTVCHGKSTIFPGKWI